MKEEMQAKDIELQAREDAIERMQEELRATREAMGAIKKRNQVPWLLSLN
jgi:hypothetical protein